MDESKLPSQEELARLAAVIFSACGTQDPHSNQAKESVKVAAHIWLYAGHFCAILQSADKGPNKSELWKIVGDDLTAAVARAMAEKGKEVIWGLAGAWKWIQDNDKAAKKDRHLSFETFKTAYAEFQGGEPERFFIPVQHLWDFLAWRKKKRAEQRMIARQKSKSSQRRKRTKVPSRAGRE